MDVGLLLGDAAIRKVLHHGIWPGPAEAEAQELRDAVGVTQKIRCPERIRAAKELGIAHRDGSHRAHHDLQVMLRRKRDEPRRGKVGVGAAERPKEIDRQTPLGRCARHSSSSMAWAIASAPAGPPKGPGYPVSARDGAAE